MSEKTDEEQREAEKRAGEKITKAKENLEKIKQAGTGTTSQTEKNAEKLREELKKKLNKLKGQLANRLYEDADNTIDDIRKELKTVKQTNEGRKEIEKAMKELEKIKDEELWISPSIPVNPVSFRAGANIPRGALARLSKVSLDNIETLDPSDIVALNNLGVENLADLLRIKAASMFAATDIS